MAYKLTVANYDRQANFKCNLLLFRCSSTHSIHYSLFKIAVCLRLSRMSSCDLHSRLLAVRCTGACDLEIAHTCYANAISRLRKFSDCAEHIHTTNLAICASYKDKRTCMMSGRQRVDMRGAEPDRCNVLTDADQPLVHRTMSCIDAAFRMLLS